MHTRVPSPANPCLRVGSALLLSLLITTSVQAADDPAYARMLGAKSPSLVTIKYVLTLTAPQGEQEKEQETTGVIVDPKGMIMASNIKMGDIERVFQIMYQGRASGISSKVKEIKVLIGDDRVGVDAEFIARDSELDLAWLRLKDPRDAPYPHVDLQNKADPQVGDRVLSVRRLGRYFDHVPVVGEGRVAGIIAKPRKLYKLSGDAGEGIGLPVYSAKGKILGFSVMQLPDLDDIGGDFAAAIGGREELQTLASGLILPIDNVIQATERAKVELKSASQEVSATSTAEENGSGESEVNGGLQELEEVNWDEELKKSENDAPEETDEPGDTSTEEASSDGS